MKFSCFTDKLREGITNVQRAVASKSTLPALEGILIATDSDKIILSGYDLEIAIKTSIEANITTEGCVVVNARLFSEMIKKAQTDYVLIEVDDNMTMTVTSGSCAFTIMAIDANEYPELPPIDEKDSIEINSELLKSMVSETIFSVSTSEDKPVHTGILFEVKPDNMRLVAVDSSRFAIRNEKIDSGKNMRFIIPAKTMNEVMKLIGENDEKIKINVGTRHVSFNVGKFLVISRLLEGDFLDYNSAIPTTDSTIVEINTQDFINSIDRMSLLIIERITTPVRCVFENNVVYLKCATALGKASDSIDCKTEGDSIEIGFNNRYMLDALKAVEDDTVKLVFSGPHMPIKVLPVDGDEFLYIILPIRLKENN